MKTLPVLSLQAPYPTKNDVSGGEAEEDDAPCEVQAGGCLECSQQVVVRVPTLVVQQGGRVQEGGGSGLGGEPGELCQEGPLQLGTGPQPVDGENDAQRAKKV